MRLITFSIAATVLMCCAHTSFAQSYSIPAERVEPFFISLYEWDEGVINAQNVVAYDATYNSITKNYLRGNQNLLVEIEDIQSQPAKAENFRQEYTYFEEMEREDRPVRLLDFEDQKAIFQADEERGFMRLRFVVENRFIVQFLMTGSLKEESIDEFLFIAGEFPVSYLSFLATYVPDDDEIRRARSNQNNDEENN